MAHTMKLHRVDGQVARSFFHSHDFHSNFAITAGLSRQVLLDLSSYYIGNIAYFTYQHNQLNATNQRDAGTPSQGRQTCCTLSLHHCYQLERNQTLRRGKAANPDLHFLLSLGSTLALHRAIQAIAQAIVVCAMCALCHFAGVGDRMILVGALAE